jgi:CO/xanthine dehydrogenase Mo-binding subunit
MTAKDNGSTDVFAAAVTRRQFVKSGGMLAVGVCMVGAGPLKGDAPKATFAKNSLDPSLPSSWLEIHADNTVLIRTGKNDFGQGSVFTAYRQIVAEELRMPFEAITTVVSGDTDSTPDGGGSFGFLNGGTPNLRKVAAYTYQALLDLAAKKLGVDRDKLAVTDGVVSGGGKSISYGDLIKGQQLNLTIPVEGDLTSIVGLSVKGNPPMKPVSEYTVVGKSFKSSAIQSKVSAKVVWATDVRLPGMMHGRVVHP